MTPERLSVIIPNFNRADALPQTIRSLARQSLHPNAFQVLVIDDGSTDNSLSLLERLRPRVPFPLQLITQDNLGPGAARNHGAREATANLLLFWDSDMIADRATLEIHRDLHMQNHSALVAGARRAWAPATTSLFAKALKAGKMGIDHFGEAPSFWEAFSSNLSIHRRDFEELGGFDEDLRAFEDIDLAYRAQQAGLALMFSREAVGYHNHQLTLDQVCRQQLHYQRYAAAFLAKHPELDGQISYLADKAPLAFGEDSISLISRKIARRLVATPLVIRALETLVSKIERLYPNPAILRFLYWKIIASYQLKGYREGLRDAIRVGH